jgi:5-methylcytosine-specific restriction endonuclease McrA
MKPYIRAYLKHHNIGEQDVLLCEKCGARAVDIHHIIFRSQGGKDNIENLIALCRECHIKAHNNKEFNKSLSHV